MLLEHKKEARSILIFFPYFIIHKSKNKGYLRCSLWSWLFYGHICCWRLPLNGQLPISQLSLWSNGWCQLSILFGSYISWRAPPPWRLGAISNSRQILDLLSWLKRWRLRFLEVKNANCSLILKYTPFSQKWCAIVFLYFYCLPVDNVLFFLILKRSLDSNAMSLYTDFTI